MPITEIAIVIIAAAIVWFLVYCILVVQRIRMDHAYNSLEQRAHSFNSVNSRRSTMSSSAPRSPNVPRGSKREERTALFTFVA
ncbi:hypothetical protein PFISCL1PPCAC_1389 [Pristionchus fissidentatus]|uniref:Uncharacterized protein n=1 Tax=Pristionchus fissidentatus TaxID=1538716 RepID=A0AAV5UUZ5_9BILA|nr:hypothetical protein PFISCL1PPCAC_1389 [Pristionchus fissidentatus]